MQVNLSYPFQMDCKIDQKISRQSLAVRRFLAMVLQRKNSLSRYSQLSWAVHETRLDAIVADRLHLIKMHHGELVSNRMIPTEKFQGLVIPIR